MGGRAAISVGKFKEPEYKELLRYQICFLLSSRFHFRNDFTQLQTILGKKKFLLGEEPTLVRFFNSTANIVRKSIAESSES